VTLHTTNVDSVQRHKSFDTKGLREAILIISP